MSKRFWVILLRATLFVMCWVGILWALDVPRGLPMWRVTIAVVIICGIWPFIEGFMDKWVKDLERR